MAELWFGIIAFMIITYVVLDGRNFGAGMLYYFVARTPEERRQVVAAIGPLWTWHEVWLVGFGGTLFVAFPKLLGAAFSGYYLALFLILWCLVFRGVALEVGGHIPDKMWQQFWDVVFAAANYLLALLFGVALGNVARGVPVGDDGTFSMAFFTNFQPAGNVGLLDWYTVSMAAVCMVFLAAHGASYLVLRTEGPVHDRSLVAQRRLWLLLPVLVVVISIETEFVRPGLAADFAHTPLAWLFALVIVAGLVMVATGIRGRDERRAFWGSGVVVVGFLAAGAATIDPVILYSTLKPENSLTVANTSASLSSLELALLWWPVAAVLSFVYLVSMARKYSGKVDVSREGMGPY